MKHLSILAPIFNDWPAFLNCAFRARAIDAA